MKWLSGHTCLATVAVDNKNTDAFINIVEASSIIAVLSSTPNYSVRTFWTEPWLTLQYHFPFFYFCVSTHPRSLKMHVCPYQDILQDLFILWVNTTVSGSGLVPVVMWEMISVVYTHHSKWGEAIRTFFFFCGLPPFYQKLWGGQRRREMSLAILV